MEHRVAAFLLALSAAAMTEGRDPCVISDSLTCGAAASLLNVDIEKLASALAALEAKGLIERDGKGLRLIDMEGLEALTQPN
jgi:CRP/FNR family transcriptional regulator